MKTLLILLFLVLPMLAMAQKLEKPTIDKFTNDTTFFTSTEKVAANKGSLSSSAENLEAYASNTNGLIFLVFKVELTTFDHQIFHVMKGNRVILKLADNTIINFTSANDVKATAEDIGPPFVGRRYWTAPVPSNIIKSDWQKIASSAITAVRVQGDKQNYDFDIKPQDSDVIKKMLTLIFSVK